MATSAESRAVETTKSADQNEISDTPDFLDTDVPEMPPRMELSRSLPPTPLVTPAPVPADVTISVSKDTSVGVRGPADSSACPDSSWWPMVSVMLRV
ncbi:UNVERIFIED_CONTAM: hypothetical protein FKN15_026318 [Acipenser sinensis]